MLGICWGIDDELPADEEVSAGVELFAALELSADVSSSDSVSSDEVLLLVVWGCAVVVAVDAVSDGSSPVVSRNTSNAKTHMNIAVVNKNVLRQRCVGVWVDFIVIRLPVGGYLGVTGM